MSFVWVSLAALVCSFVGSLPSPGPSRCWSSRTAVSGRYRRRSGSLSAPRWRRGIYAFLAFWGFATFLARYELVLPNLSRGDGGDPSGPRGALRLLQGGGEEAVGRRKSARFWVGFSISALNPTLLATWAPVTTSSTRGQLVQFHGHPRGPLRDLRRRGVRPLGLFDGDAASSGSVTPSRPRGSPGSCASWGWCSSVRGSPRRSSSRGTSPGRTPPRRRRGRGRMYLHARGK